MPFAIVPFVLTQLAIFALSHIFRERPKAPKPEDFNQFDAPTADESRKVSWLFGPKIIRSPNVAWYGANGVFVKKIHKTPAAYAPHYNISLHLVWTRDLDEINQVLVEDKLAWSGSVTSNETFRVANYSLLGGEYWKGPSGDGGVDMLVDAQFGAANQEKNAYLVKKLGPDIPAYRHVVTTTIRGDTVDGDAAYVGNSGYLKNIAIRGTRLTSGWHGGVWYPEKLSIDGLFNPIHAVYQIFTDPTDGFGIVVDRLNDASFRAAADILYSEGFGIKFEWTESSSIQDILAEIFSTISGTLYRDRTDGKFNIILFRHNEDFGGLLSFDESNSTLIEYEILTIRSTVNQMRVIFTNPDTDEDAFIVAHALENVLGQGRIVADEVSYRMVADAATAYRLGERDIRIKSQSLFTAKLSVDRKAWKIHEGQRVLISDADNGLANEPVRVMNIDYGSTGDRSIVITVIKDAFSMPTAIFLNNQSSGWLDLEDAPQKITNYALYEANYFDLANYADALDLTALSGQESFIVGVAESPAPQNKQFRIYSSLTDDTPSYVADDYYGGYAKVATLYSSASALATEIIQNGVSSFSPNSNIDESYEIGLWAFLGDESIYVESGINLNYSGTHRTTLTVRRGCFDTIPSAHSSGDKIWFFNGVNGVIDQVTKHTKGLVENYRFVPSGYTIDGLVSDADTITYANNARWSRPWPPADVKIDDQYFPSSADGYFTLTCSGRNAKEQAALENDGIIEWTGGHITEEDGVTYTLIVKDRSTDALIAKIEGLTGGPSGFSYVFDVSNSATGYKIEFFTIKNGVECWQKFTHEFNITGFGTIDYPQVPSAVYFNSKWQSVINGSGGVFDLSGGGQRLTFDGGSDATSWSVTNSDLSADVYNGVTYFADSKMIAQNGNSPLLAYRTTGDWVDVDLSDYADAYEQSGGVLNAIFYNGSAWVIVRNYGNDIATTTDFSTFTNVAGANTKNDLSDILSCVGLIKIGSSYIAVGTSFDPVMQINYTKMASSADLITWVDQGNVVPAVQMLQKAVYFNSLYFVWGVEQSAGANVVAVYKSSDGISWSKIALDVQSGFDDALMLVIGSYINIAIGDYVFKSSDGSSFTKSDYKYIFSGADIDPVLRAKLMPNSTSSAPSVAMARTAGLLRDGGRLISLSALDSSRSLVYPSSHAMGTTLGIVRADVMNNLGKITENGFRIRRSKYLNGKNAPKIAIGRRNGDGGSYTKRYFEVEVLDFFGSAATGIECGLCDRNGNQFISIRSDGGVYSNGVQIASASLSVNDDSVFAFMVDFSAKNVKIYHREYVVTTGAHGPVSTLSPALKYTYSYQAINKTLFPFFGCVGAEVRINAGQPGNSYVFTDLGSPTLPGPSYPNYGWVRDI